MAIQFGSTAINAIKYCNASGALQDVTSVVRNGAYIFGNDPRERTDNEGYWYQEPRSENTNFEYDQSSGSFINAVSGATLKYEDGQWVCDVGGGFVFYCEGNEYTKTLEFEEVGEFKWSMSSGMTSDNGIWHDDSYDEDYLWNSESQRFEPEDSPSQSRVFYDENLGKWVWDDYLESPCYSTGNKFSQTLNFSELSFTMTWRAS